jgi:hypothetical protein
MISISEKNYDLLRRLGTITDSFDSVITKLLNAAVPLLEKEREV